MYTIITTARGRKIAVEDMRWLVEAIAVRLWKRHGGHGTLDWPAVERSLRRMVEQAREDARDSRQHFISLLAPAFVGAKPTSRRRRSTPPRDGAYGSVPSKRHDAGDGHVRR